MDFEIISHMNQTSISGKEALSIIGTTFHMS